MTDMTVSKTILEQLGGSRFVVMTGAKTFTGDTNALSFRLPGTMCIKGINYVKITLNAEDTYDILFLKLRGANFSTIADRKNIYAEQLRDVFTKETGLMLSLGTMGRVEMKKFNNKHED
jgi:hypothetical protein